MSSVQVMDGPPPPSPPPPPIPDDELPAEFEIDVGVEDEDMEEFLAALQAGVNKKTEADDDDDEGPEAPPPPPLPPSAALTTWLAQVRRIYRLPHSLAHAHTHARTHTCAPTRAHSRVPRLCLTSPCDTLHLYLHRSPLPRRWVTYVHDTQLPHTCVMHRETHRMSHHRSTSFELIAVQ